MPRTQRFIRPGGPHELDLRVRSGLPFACKQLITLLLRSAMARAQRDRKVILHHFIWNGNHVHMFITPFDAQQAVNYYQEVQKKITEAIKRLLGLHRLTIWEGDPILAEILDLEEAIERVSYFYANPAQDNLVETIEEYPGCSSYRDFRNSKPELIASVSHQIPWIRLPSIPKLKSLTLSEAEDEALTAELEKKNRKKSHDLTIYPNGWMKAFGVTDRGEIEAINERIIARVREREAKAREKRIVENKTVLGVSRLKSQPIMKPHTPPPRKRRVYMLSSVPELRVRHAAAMKKFVSYCKRCYQEVKAGKSDCQWPPGAIRPWLPPVANPIVDLETLMFSLEI